VGHRAGLDTEVRGKFLCPCRRSNLDKTQGSHTIKGHPEQSDSANRRYSWRFWLTDEESGTCHYNSYTVGLFAFLPKGEAVITEVILFCILQ
jgi:hypothetical protein